MKSFFKDYGYLCKLTGEFYMKHCVGCIIMNAVIFGAEMGWLCKDSIKGFVKEKFAKD